MIRKVSLFISFFILTIGSFSSIANAMTQNDLRAILEGHPYYDAIDSCDIANTGTTSLISGTSEENKKIIWQYLIGKGLTAEQTAGIMGNLQAEGGFEPRRVEYGPPWKNSRGEISLAGQPSSLDENMPPMQNDKGQPGYGIVQWTSPGRRQGLADLANSRNVKPSDLGVQLDYLWKELTGSHKAAYDDLKQATTIAEASKAIVVKFEAPQGYNTASVQNARANYGEKIYKQFVGQDPGMIVTTTQNNGCNSMIVGDIDCSNAIGNAKIVCAAQQNFGTMYCFTDNHNGHLGNCGHGPQQWLDAVAKNGKESAYYSTECSGFVNIALYQAFGYDKDNCSSTYKNDTDNFKVVPIDSIVPGDLVIEHINEGCGTGNHVAIVESYDPSTGKLVTLESTAGRNDDGKIGISGRLSYRKLGVDFDGAVRYIGQGSGQ